MKVKCINNKNKPEEIPNSLWLKLNEIYTVINSFKDMNNVLLYQLEEIELTLSGTLYKGYAATRFVPIDEDGPLTDEELDDLLQEIEVHKLETI